MYIYDTFTTYLVTLDSRRHLFLLPLIGHVPPVTSPGIQVLYLHNVSRGAAYALGHRYGRN